MIGATIWMDSPTIDFQTETSRCRMLNLDPARPKLRDAALPNLPRACLQKSYFSVGGASINVFLFAFSKVMSLLLALVTSVLTWSLFAATASKEGSSSSGVLTLLVVFQQDYASQASAPPLRGE